MLRVESTLNGTRESTIISGVVQFWQEGDYPVALIIFIASIIIPVLKFLAITMLCLGVRFGYWPRALTQLYRVTDYIGRWRATPGGKGDGTARALQSGCIAAVAI